MRREIEAELLGAVEREVARLTAIDLYKQHPTDRSTAAVALRVKVENARVGVVAADLDRLIGRQLGEAAAKAFWRAAAALEAAGKLQRLRRGWSAVKTTHFRLVAGGAEQSGDGPSPKARRR